jgi:hypothetical protein
MALGVDHSFFAFVLFDLTGGPKLSKIVCLIDYECFNLADI